jgi:hypothetical protein
MVDQGFAGPDDEEIGRFSDALTRLTTTLVDDRVEIGALNVFLGCCSIAGLLLILALPMALPIPAPGISVIFGVPLILISAQLLIGRRRAWLPSRLERLSISRADFVAWVDRALPMLRRFEQIVRPRLGWFADDWALIPVGAICFVLALIITLPIPLGHMVPGAAISLMALGLIERDGLVVGFGLIIAALGLALVTAASVGIVATLRAWFGM